MNTPTTQDSQKEKTELARVLRAMKYWAKETEKYNVVEAAQRAATLLIDDIVKEQPELVDTLSGLETINALTTFIMCPIDHLEEMSTRQDPDDRKLGRQGLKIIKTWESIPRPIRYAFGFVQGIPYRLTPGFFIDYMIDRQSKKFADALDRPVEEVKAEYIMAMNAIYDALEKFPDGFPIMQGFCKSAKMSKWRR